MCGICGILGRPDREATTRMTAAMIHRGPDDAGFYFDERVALGFRRLAIIDVAGGMQPLYNEDRSVQVIFNGEIYNHQHLRKRLERKGHILRTASDGEVLAHLYEEAGPYLVDELNGIFALALWDRKKHLLLLARDHHGVKPLYYSEQNGLFLFASEIKAILASGHIERKLDAEAVGQYLIYQAVPPPLSIVANVRQVPPGNILLHDGQTIHILPYWNPVEQKKEPVESVDEACDLVRSGLEQAVGLQMMSERPLGVFLSGGVDSSALVAMAAPKVPGRLKTFSVGFRGPDEELFTEWPWAQRVAELYGTDHHEIVLTEEDFRERLPHVLKSMDQPTSDGINSYYVSLAAAEQVTVALSGTGGDELFLGYPRDAALLAQYGRGRLLFPLPAGYVLRVGRYLARLSEEKIWKHVQDMKQAAASYANLDGEFLSPRGIGIFDERGRDRVLDLEFRRRAGGFRSKTEYLKQDVPRDPSTPGDWLSRLEQRGYLSFVLLRDIDAMSMAHSLEVRVPFLDPTYGETLSRIPWEWKLRDGVGKWILKRALRDLLPEEILNRPKMGFGLPYNIWMRRSLEPILRDMLSGERLRKRGIFDIQEVSALLKRFYGGDDSVWRNVWTLFVLEAWTTQTLDPCYG